MLIIQQGGTSNDCDADDDAGDDGGDDDDDVPLNKLASLEATLVRNSAHSLTYPLTHWQG